MREIWIDIDGFDGVYQVSNRGNVRSLTHTQRYTTSLNRNVTRTVKGKILLPTLTASGYLGVTLYRNGKKMTKLVHNLVATTFIENSTALPQINHKDEDKMNNRVENLEWCTCKYNINHGTANSRRSITQKRNRGVFQ